jgi:hypothetical protein
VLGDESHNAAQHTGGLYRRWLFLRPAVFIAYSLGYLGRSNFGFGAAVKTRLWPNGVSRRYRAERSLRKEPGNLGAKDSGRVRM